MSRASSAAAPRAIHSGACGRRAATNAPSTANATYTTVRFVYCQLSSGEIDHNVVTPNQTASPARSVRKTAASVPSGGASTNAIAARTSAPAPIHTSEESVVPRAKKNAANERAPAPAARTAPARTAQDASIASRSRRPVHKRFTWAKPREHRRWRDLPEGFAHGRLSRPRTEHGRQDVDETRHREDGPRASRDGVRPRRRACRLGSAGRHSAGDERLL